MGSAAATRRRILEAAYARFYRDGFARVGVDAVAAAAGGVAGACGAACGGDFAVGMVFCAFL